MKPGKPRHNKKLKSRLPVHVAPDKVWKNVEEHFNLKESEPDTFSKVWGKLPVHEPDEKVWKEIEIAIFNKSKKTLRFISKKFLKMAASILIIIGLSTYIFVHKNYGLYRIYYSVEEANPAFLNFYEIEIVESDQMSKLIDELCFQNYTYCNSELYNGLKEELEILETEREKIMESYLNRKDIQLLRYLNSIDKQKREIQKKILKYSNTI